MTEVRVQAIVKRFGSAVALDGVDLAIRRGELFTLLGPSGCGKTTLLRIVAGLLPQDTGTVTFDGLAIDAVPAYERNVGVVFQSYAIFPHLTVRGNIEYGLTARRVPAGEAASRATEAARLVRLEALLDRMPAALSGGQQQRVVLARALVIHPRLLLMDEPLSNLDARLRVEMRGLIRRLQRELGITTLYVTHDQEEALAISDTIAVLDRGRVVQVGTPRDLYRAPATRFVAEFLGSMDVLPGRVIGRDAAAGLLTVDLGLGAPWQVPDTDGMPTDGTVHLGVRPEWWRLDPVPGAPSGPADREVGPGAGPSVRNRVRGHVTEVVYLGPVARCRVEIGRDLALTAEIHDPEPARVPAVGSAVDVWCLADRVLRLPPDP